MSGEFDGRVALVTGGSRGIGRATALRLAEEGADVAISYVSREAEAHAVIEAIRALGRRSLAVSCDVGDAAQVTGMVEQVRAALGPIDLLVHSGAISSTCEHTELDLAQWEEMIRVNLTGSYLVVFAVKDEMIARGYGRIVLLSSIAALAPRPRQIHYSASKAGVIAMIRGCAEAFAPHNVRINGLAPGLIDTEMARVLSPAQMEAVVAATPMRRLGEPEEMAGAIRFLLSDDASFVTGQTLVASGGRVMVP